MSSMRMSSLLNGEESTIPKEKVTKDSSKIWWIITLVVLGFIMFVIASLVAIPIAVSRLSSRIDGLEERLEVLKDVQAILDANHLTPKNCMEYQVEESGYYTVDPMKQNGQSSKFKVYCDDQDKETTEVYHDKPHHVDIDGCDEYNCFRMKITYDTSYENIHALVESSSNCFQEIHFTCSHATISGYSGLIDGRGKHEITNCRCHEWKSCIDDDKKCNCDIGDSANRSDVISISDKDLLPITGFYYNRTEKENQRATVNIGPLVCKGSKPLIGDSCLNLKRLGEPSGFYVFPRGKDVEMRKCDMSRINFEARLEVHERVIVEDGKEVDLALDKIIIDGNERNELKPPQSGNYNYTLSLMITNSVNVFVNGKELVVKKETPSTIHLLENENLNFIAKCKDGNQRNCVVNCSQMNPCEIVFSKVLTF